MPKQQLNVRISSLTRSQLDTLRVKLGLNEAEVIGLAVERLWQWSQSQPPAPGGGEDEDGEDEFS